MSRSARETIARTAVVRDAVVEDLDALVRLEERCFTGDRISRRNLRRLLRRGHCIALVAEQSGTVAGYALVLLHATTALARLYSLAVDPALQGHGIGARLLQAVEQRARDRGRALLRLEVRPDSAAAMQRYRGSGYRDIGVKTDYYEDHSGALRMEKQLAGGDLPDLAAVPYYAQTLEFTCGPASLMMAMHALDPTTTMARTSELALWRESTLIFMTSGHGGCGPRGLALAASGRGFDAQVYVSHDGPPFLDSVRSEEKRAVMRLVHEDFGQRCRESRIPVHIGVLSAAGLGQAIESGAVPIVLISIYRLTGDKAPHWVVVTGIDEHFIYIHDPYVDADHGKTAMDSMNVPIARREFDRMARYGSSRLRATVLVSRGARAP